MSSGLYNIQGKETLTVKELVRMIHQSLGKEVPENCFGTATRADVGMKYLALDGGKLKSQINFEAKVSILEALADYK